MNKTKYNPIVNICMITYNHENYVAEAIEGILMQKTSFSIKLIIGEDNSTDKTRTICEEYAAKYPTLIELLPKHECNLGMSNNFIRTISACKGKYISFCEGDDYWIYDKKLEEQVNFLENNNSYSICSHIYKIKCPQKEYTDRYGNLIKPGSKGLSFNLEDHLNYWLAKTLTLTIKNNVDYANILKKYNYARDAHLIYHALEVGNGYCCNFIGGVYRKHKGGVHSSLSKIQNAHDKLIVYGELSKLNKKNKLLKKKYNEIVKHFLNTLINYYIFEFRHNKKWNTSIAINKNIVILILSNLTYTLIITIKLLLKRLGLYSILKSLNKQN